MGKVEQMSLRTERLNQHQTVIDIARLDELYRKEANHDGYVRASLAMSVRQRKRQTLAKTAHGQGMSNEATYHLGWLDCLKEYNETVLDLISRQVDSHPHMDARPRRIRKGQLCLVDEPGCDCLRAIRKPISEYNPSASPVTT
jgi:hypothetical protein